MVYRLVTAVITQFYVPSEAPTIPRLVPQKLLVTANSLFAFTYYSSLGVGSIVAGPVLRLFGPHAVFILISVLFALAAWFAWRLPKEVGKQSQLPRPTFSKCIHIIRQIAVSMREGWAYVKKSPAIAEALLLLTGTQIVLALLGTLGPGFADRVLGIDVRDASILITGPAVFGIMLGSLWVGTWVPESRRVNLSSLASLPREYFLFLSPSPCD